MAIVLWLSAAVASFAPPTRLAHNSANVAVAARSSVPCAADMPGAAAAMTPLQDFVLVDLQSVPSSTDAGILLPTVYYDFEEKNEEAFVKPAPRAGTVVAVGPGRRSFDGNVVIPMPPISPGQKVVCGAEKGEKVVLDGEAINEATHYLFRVDELFGYCDPE